jgi:hypothetical protein
LKSQEVQRTAVDPNAASIGRAHSDCSKTSIYQETTETTMNRGSKITKAIPLLLGIGFLLSACGTAPGYGAATYPYAYSGYAGNPYDPIYGPLDFGFGGFGDFHHDRDFHRGHDGHDFAQHGGHSFARFGGHGFAMHGGFGGHGGGGHR